MKGLLRKEQKWISELNPVARGFIPVRLRSSRKTRLRDVADKTRVSIQRAASQPHGDKSPHHKGARESDRQMHAKGIHAMVAVHEHIAAMHQGNRLDDGQAQPMVVATVAA